MLILQPLSSAAFKLNKSEAEKYRELDKACELFVVNHEDAMDFNEPQFVALIGDNPALAQWLNSMVNRNSEWNASLVCHAEQWYRLSQNHQEFVQALANAASTSSMLTMFQVSAIEKLLTNSPLTARAMLDLIRVQSRLAFEMLHNIHAIASCASLAGDALMQQRLQALTGRHASISELFHKLDANGCIILNAGLMQYYLYYVGPFSYPLNLTDALQNLADNHLELLQAISSRGNANKEITSLIQQLAQNPQQAEVAARAALSSQQTAATPCPYCLEVFFVVLGIGHVMSKTK